MVNEDKVKSDEVKIVGGPGKWDLIALALAETQPVIFETHTHAGERLLVKANVVGLIGLEWQAPNVWRVLGKVINNYQELGNLFKDPRYDLAIHQYKLNDPVYFYAKYSTHDRTGIMRIALINSNEDNPFDPKYFPF